MSWEQRLREMMFAGGAVAVACGTSSGGSAGGGVPSFCCNANGDPCCTYLYCHAPLSPECSAKLACDAEGGVWSYQSSNCASGQDAAPDAPDGHD
jgi:hypothetical protein